MRTAELLNALSQTKPGLMCLVGPDCSTIETLYEPRIRYDASTLFEAALLVAAEMLAYSNCPLEVQEALEAYECHTRHLNLQPPENK